MTRQETSLLPILRRAGRRADATTARGHRLVLLHSASALAVAVMLGAAHKAAAQTAVTIAAGTTLAPTSFYYNEVPVTDNGTFDISGAPNGGQITSLSGTGTVTLGAQQLGLTDASGTFSGTIADGGSGGGTGGELLLFGGTETLAGTNTYTGQTQITGGTLALSGTGSIATSHGVGLFGGLPGASGATSTLDISGTTDGASITNLVGGGVVALGSKNLTLTGSSTVLAATITDGGIAGGTGGSLTVANDFMTLTGTNTYTGGTTIDHNTVLTGTTASFGTGAITDNGNLDINQSTSGTLSNVVSGSGGLVTNGSGTVTLTGTNSYSGGTTIGTGSTLALSGAGSVGSGEVYTSSGDAFDISGTTNGATITSLSGYGTVALGSQNLTLTNASDFFSGTIADGGIVDGTGGSLTLAGGHETLTNVDTYTGTTVINAGTLALSGAGSIASSRGVVDNGTFDVSGTNGTTITSLSGNGTVALGGQTLTLSNASGTFSGTITGDPVPFIGGGGGLTLNGGTETLTGTNTYTGPTSINAGTLALSGAGSIAASNVVYVNPGSTFDISGTTNGASVTYLFDSDSTTIALGSKTLTVAGLADPDPYDVTMAGGAKADLQSDSFGVIADGGIAGGTGGGVTLAVGSASGLVATSISGNNTYTGLTTIDSGTALILSNSLFGESGVASIASSSGVVDNGIFDISANTTVTTAAGGSTAVINAGTTSITTLSGDGIVSLGNQNLTLTNASGTFSGTITDDSLATQAAPGSSVCSLLAAQTCSVTGGGSLTLASGTETLTGTNTYTGGTTIESGTLTGTTASFGTGAIVDNGTLDISQSTDGTLANVVSGNGSLVKDGTGTATLTGDDTYTGATVINAGTLALSGAGSIASSSGVADNGTFDVSGTKGTAITSLSGNGTVALGGQNLTLSNASGTFSGTITDGGIAGGTGGSLTLVGNETLSGANSYTGGTTIQSGTLTVGNGSALGTGTLNMAEGTTLVLGGSNIVLNNAIVLNGDPTIDVASGSDTLAGTISDGTTPGILLKTGAGTLVTTGNSTYSGGTEVSTGTLQVDGTLASPVSVDKAGTLSGTGTVGTTNVTGTLAPGNAGTGTLHVNGNLTLAAGSTYVAGVTAASGQVQVSGTATLQGGTIAIMAGTSNWTTAAHYTFLTAGGGVSGTFGAVTSNLAFLTPSLTSGADGVSLTLQRNALEFAGVGTTRNEIATGGALSGTTSGALYDALVQTDAATARHALNRLAGDLHASARTALIQDSYYVRDAAVERLRGVECAPGAASGMKTATGGKPTDGACRPGGAAVWMQDYGSFGHNGGNGNASGMGHSVGGFVLGADAPVLGWQVGGLVGYGHSSFDSGAVSSYGHSSNVSLGLYAGTHWGRLALRMGATYSWNMLSTTRNVGFTGFSNRLNTDYNGGTAQAFGDLGYRFDAGPAMIEPFADVAYVNLHTNGYIEHGGPAALAGRAMDTGVTYSTFGARFAGTVRVGAIALTPNATLGYRHAFGLTTPTTREAFLAGGNAFDVAGVPLSTDAAVLKAGLQARLTDRLNVGLSYVGQYGDHSTDSGLTGNVKVTF